MRPTSSPGELLRTWWGRLSGLPGGRFLFSRILGQVIPYTGSVRPFVLELSPGHARVRIHDRRAIRNHLRSIHALALSNVGEFSTGLALNVLLPSTLRSIPTSVSTRYLKKARGVITAEARVSRPVGESLQLFRAAQVGEPPPEGVVREVELESVLTDEAGDVVARTTVLWKVGPAPGGRATGA